MISASSVPPGSRSSRFPGEALPSLPLSLVTLVSWALTGAEFVAAFVVSYGLKSSAAGSPRAFGQSDPVLALLGLILSTLAYGVLFAGLSSGQRWGRSLGTVVYLGNLAGMIYAGILILILDRQIISATTIGSLLILTAVNIVLDAIWLRLAWRAPPR